MPDDVKQPAGDPGPQPQIDLESVRAAAGDAVRDALKDWKPPEPQYHEPAPAPRPEPVVSNPLADVIGPLVNPALRHLGTEVADAKDAALFYVEHPEMLKHKDGVEKAFNILKQQGTPMSRDAVGKWYRGQHFEEFHKAALEEERAAAERARDGADVGPGASRDRKVIVKDAHAASDEDLAKALDGVAF